MSREIEHNPSHDQTLAFHWDDVETALEWFTEHMIDKFEAVQHKGHWQYVEIGYLYERLCAEMEELSTGIDTGEDAAHLIGECVDVANCALMLADWLRMMRGE